MDVLFISPACAAGPPWPASCCGTPDRGTPRAATLPTRPCGASLYSGSFRYLSPFTALIPSLSRCPASGPLPALLPVFGIVPVPLPKPGIPSRPPLLRRRGGLLGRLGCPVGLCGRRQARGLPLLSGLLPGPPLAQLPKLWIAPIPLPSQFPDPLPVLGFDPVLIIGTLLPDTLSGPLLAQLPVPGIRPVPLPQPGVRGRPPLLRRGAGFAAGGRPTASRALMVRFRDLSLTFSRYPGRSCTAPCSAPCSAP